MKLLVLFSVLVHIATAILPGLPGYELFGAITGGGGSNDVDVPEPVESPAPATTSRFPGGQVAGRVLDVKIGLLTALRNILSPEAEHSVDFEDGFNGNTGVAVTGGQMFSPDSQFNALEVNSGSSSSANAYSGASGNAYSGGSASQGYNYERPPPRVYRRFAKH